MTGLYLPGAAWRPISYRADAGAFPAPPIGEIIHVVVGNGSPWGAFEFAPAGDRRFSNAWVAKDGSSEQYTELNIMPWAQEDGNPYYYAWETEGFPGEPLTGAQITTLATWHNFAGTPDIVTDTPGAAGSLMHADGGAAYGGHSCPGPGPRGAQRTAVIDWARALRHLPPAPPVRPPAPPIGKIVLVVDGVFGPQSRMRLQQWAGVAMDSVLGPISWAAIQRKVGGLVVDGNPGPLTWAAIQRMVGSPADGIPGPNTYSHLQAYLNGH